MRKALISTISVSVILLSGCASTSQPTSKVGIVNGKYAVRTTIPNNNKGKKVNITMGQSYSCESSLVKKDGKQVKYTFDLKISQDGNHITWYNDKEDGVALKTSYIGKFVFKPGLGFVETTQNDQVMVLGRNNTGTMATFASVKDAQKFLKMLQKFQNGKLTKSEWQNQKVRMYESVCTQTTNNTYTRSRYLTNHEIDAYKHGQQIAVQQRAIDSANYNATMDRIQAKNAQRKYNTQQTLNRLNTSSQSIGSINGSSNNKFYMHSDGTSTRKVGNTYYHSNGTTTTAY